MQRIDVICYAGYRGDEEPRAFIIDGARFDVLGIAKRWEEPGARFFEVRAHDGDRYTLRHDRVHDAWILVAVQRAQA